MNAKLLTLLTACAVACGADLAPSNDAGVAMGHLHVNVSNVAAAKHFWIDILGAAPMKLGTIEGVEVPGAIVLFKLAAPSGGTVDSAVNHVGVSVKTLSDYPPRLQAAGLKFTANKNGKQIMVDGPDGLRVELTQNTALQTQVAMHHIHLYTTQVPEMQAWYAKTFGAIPGKRAVFEAADLPGVNLSFSHADSAPVPTKGRALDHFGFEVRNLEAFCKRLEANGVKFDVAYKKVPALGISVAFLTDPWGAYIELTEGLRKS